MGIDYQTAWFLGYCSSYSGSSSLLGKVDFSRTITLGRQFFLIPREGYNKIFKILFGDTFDENQIINFHQKIESTTMLSNPSNKYSEPFFELLGGGDVDSLDYSDYEDATIIQDITVPIPNELKNKYTCVFDGGLLEHVYEYPVALKNAMDMVAIGGHVILATPGNNWFGHGFYQFSPELFYSVLREENGFADTRVYLCDNDDKWYLVKNPREIHRRTDISPNWLFVSLYVVSKKIGEVPYKVMTYQSDYEERWESRQLGENKPIKFRTALLKIYSKTPSVIRRYVLKAYHYYRYKRRFKDMFTEVNLKTL